MLENHYVWAMDFFLGMRGVKQPFALWISNFFQHATCLSVYIANLLNWR